MAQRASSKEDRIDLPMYRQDIADYLGLTLETVSRVLWDLERRGAIKIAKRHSIVLCGRAVNGSTEKLRDIFEAVKGRQPKTEQELDDWLTSLEGRAATLFDLTSLSYWGERARS